MIEKAHLQSKNVVVKISSLPNAMPATVSLVENDGIWFLSSDLVAALAKAMGGLPSGIKTPATYVPFSQILWLIAPNE